MKLAAAVLTLALTFSACCAKSYNWTTIATDVATAATGIAFINSTFGYLPGDANGQGAEILISQNGGKSWNPSPHFGGFLLLDVSAYGPNAVVSGVFGDQYTEDYGQSFSSSNGGGTSQCVRNINRFGSGGPDGFGVAGTVGLNETDGIAVSFDDGKSFTEYPISELKTFARYAAFPTKSDFYVTAGQWPESDTDDDAADDFSLRGSAKTSSTFYKSQRFSVRREGRTSVSRISFGSTAGNGTFKAQIAVSHDGGNTFKSALYEEGWYANGIACESSSKCCMVGEADQGPSPGARIHCTADGGETWKQTLFQSGGQHSLIDIAWVANDEYWAVGGVFETFKASAQFLHTTDGGETWTAASSIDGYATSVDCVDASNCWATLIHDLTQSSSVAKLEVSG